MSLPPSLALVLGSDPGFPCLKEHLIETTGLAYYSDKNEALTDRIARRLRHLGLSDCAAYLALLRDRERGEAELDAVIQELTIGETFFFRHREMFDALRDQVIPELIERNRDGRRLRIWSAGCATGAEPYSIAILLRHDLAPQLVGWDITIVGTDINRAFLARAREGRFEEWAFRTNPEDLKHTCFVRADKSWIITPPFKEGVSFQYHNLVRHPYPSLVNNLFAFDLILCRNVAIYFSHDIVRKIVDQFHRCLVDNGWLLVGAAEPNTQLFHSFRQVSAPGAVLYQKSAEPNVAKTWRAGGISPLLPPQQGADVPPSPSTPSYPSSSGFQPGPATESLDDIRSLADRGEWEKAERSLARLLAKDRLNPHAYFLSALLKEQAGKHQDAQEALRKVLYLDRHFVLAHYYLGLLLQKMGETAGAARSFRNALTILEPMDDEHAFAEAEGANVADLKKLTRMHLAVLEIA